LDLPSPVLVIAPHPDDETFGCGGTLSLITKRGVPVHVAFVTDGSASHPHHPRVTGKEVASLRRREAQKATSRLGIRWEDIIFLGAQDGSLSQLDDRSGDQLADQISRVLEGIKPKTILLPCRKDGSSEHEASFLLVGAALRRVKMEPRLLEFPIWCWWNPLMLPTATTFYRKVWRVDLDQALASKTEAAASYASQTLPIPPDQEAALPRGFVPLFLGGEEFLFER
jgi:LmbE family N-acetylglucosaminyl deacetylase